MDKLEIDVDGSWSPRNWGCDVVDKVELGVAVVDGLGSYIGQGCTERAVAVFVGGNGMDMIALFVEMRKSEGKEE